MHSNPLRLARRTFFFCLLFLCFFRGSAQPELEPWGNLTGIRVDGHLMEFESSLRIAGMNGLVQATGKERQNPHYSRVGSQQIVNTRLDSLYFTETVTESGVGTAQIRVSCMAHADVKLNAVLFSLDLPDDLSGAGKVVRIGDKGIGVVFAHRQLEIQLEQAALISDTLIVQCGRRHIRIDIVLQSGDLQKGQSTETGLVIHARGDIDREPIHLLLHPATEGRVFDGLGGNFRIQNVALDPQVIAFCLQHLRVAWGRVELPWRSWQPFSDGHPLDSARAGRVLPAVQRAMDMAKTLGEKKIPVIVSAWFPPDWAIEGPIRFRPGPDHIWGNALNKAQTEAIYRSISDYIVFLKERYQVEAEYFSFNESDLGINVRQTAQEHDELIKGLGAAFAARGLRTKVLLGDNSDATTYSFIDVAKDDAAARPYMGAISFHSWRGWDTATLQKWADAATKLRLPLLVGEGSIDAAAWNYPGIFLEPTYALQEISLYTQLLAICQPQSILQWQLTSDYSPLAGGEIFHDSSALHPTQRFFNLQQLSMTPPGLFAMPLTCDRPNITFAALGSNKRHVYALHLVNNGATRDVILQGLPSKVKTLHIYTTNQQSPALEGAPVKVSGGLARFVLPAQSYVTLISGE